MQPMTQLQTKNVNRDVTAALGNLSYTGTVFFVSSGTGSSANAGKSIAKPKATIAQALALCTAGKGDVVVVMPGHAEDLTAAAAITASTSGVTILGVGNGRARPTLTWKTSTAAQFIVTGANTTFKNMVFDLTGIDAVVAAFAVDAADVAFEDCEFITNAAAAGVVSGITVGGTTTSPRFRVTNCRFRGPATNSGTTTTAQITITDAPDFEIAGNFFTGKCTQNITNGAANLRGEIHANRFVTYTGTKALNFHASSTPFVSNNRFNVPSGTAPVVAAAGFMSGNNYSAAAGVTAGTASTF